jgi:hypothetical protein
MTRAAQLFLKECLRDLSVLKLDDCKTYWAFF